MTDLNRKKASAIVFSLEAGGSGFGFKNFIDFSIGNFLDLDVQTTDQEIPLLRFFHSCIAKGSHLLVNLLCVCTRYKTLNFYDRIRLKEVSADVLVLGWIGNNTITLSTLEKFTGKVLIRLSDEWWWLALRHYDEGRSSILERIQRRKFHNFLLRKNVFLICPSNWLKSRCLRYVPVCPSKIFVVPNRFPPQFFASSEIRFKRNQIVFSCERVSDPRKGFKYTSNIKLLDQSSFELHVAGRASFLLKRRFRKAIFHGFLKREALHEIYRNSKYILCLARYDTSPNAILEAMCFGCVPIYFKGTGIEDYIEPSLRDLLSIDCSRDIDAKILSVEDSFRDVSRLQQSYLELLTTGSGELDRLKSLVLADSDA